MGELIRDSDLGSQVFNVETDDTGLLPDLVDNLGEGFREVWYDLAADVAEFTSPSGAHEDAVFDARGVIEDARPVSLTDITRVGVAGWPAPE